MDSINGISYYLKCQTLSNTSQMTFCFLWGIQRIGAHALYMQHSPIAAALSTSFLLNHAPQQPELNALTTRFRKSYSSVSMSRKSKKTEEIKEQLVEFWQCTDTAFEWKKMRFSCFPVLPGSAEAHVIWGGIVKCFLIAYFMDNISAKNIKMCSRMSKF